MHLDVPTSICNLKDATFATRGLELEADKLYAQQLVDARVVFLVTPVGGLGLSVIFYLFGLHMSGPVGYASWHAARSSGMPGDQS